MCAKIKLYAVGTGCSFPELKRPGCEADFFRLMPSVRMVGAIPPIPLYASVACSGTNLLFTYAVMLGIACCVRCMMYVYRFAKRWLY